MDSLIQHLSKQVGELAVPTIQKALGLSTPPPEETAREIIEHTIAMIETPPMHERSHRALSKLWRLLNQIQDSLNASHCVSLLSLLESYLIKSYPTISMQRSKKRRLTEDRRTVNSLQDWLVWRQQWLYFFSFFSW